MAVQVDGVIVDMWRLWWCGVYGVVVWYVWYIIVGQCQAANVVLITMQQCVSIYVMCMYVVLYSYVYRIVWLCIVYDIVIYSMLCNDMYQ